MATCCICWGKAGGMKIAEGNPAYYGKPVCKDCQRYRKLLLETR